jgi:hypothetical protein
MPTRNPARSRRRGAINSFELLLLMPIILIILLGIIEISLMLAAKARLSCACWEGARCAAHGHPDDEVRRCVCRHFDSHVWDCIEVVVIPGCAPHHGHHGDDGGDDNTDGFGSQGGSGPPGHRDCDDTVTVHVKARASCLVPDLLGFICIRLCERDFVCESTLRKE